MDTKEKLAPHPGMKEIDQIIEEIQKQLTPPPPKEPVDLHFTREPEGLVSLCGQHIDHTFASINDAVEHPLCRKCVEVARKEGLRLW